MTHEPTKPFPSERIEVTRTRIVVGGTCPRCQAALWFHEIEAADVCFVPDDCHSCHLTVGADDLGALGERLAEYESEER